MPATYTDLTQNIVDFCAVLRVQGFIIGAQESQDVFKAIEHIDIHNYEQFKHTLGLTLCSSKEEEEIFEVLFRAYFLPRPVKEAPPESQAKASNAEDKGADDNTNETAPQARKKQHANAAPELAPSMAELGDVQDSEDEDAEGAGATTLKAKFSPYSSQDYQSVVINREQHDDMMLAASQLMKRLKLGKSRRWKSMPKGSRLDFRRTLRKSLQTGGETIKPAFLAHPRRKAKIVMLLDGSRSMATYSDKLLQFAHAISQRSSKVEVFLFSTELGRATNKLRKARASTTAPTLDDLGESWGGGTKIGGSLSTFVRKYATGMLSWDTLVIIASDGFDTGKADVLARAMRDIQRRCASVIWLNPVMDSEGYEPTAAGMQAALPYIDTFTTAKRASDFSDLAKSIRLRR